MEGDHKKPGEQGPEMDEGQHIETNAVVSAEQDPFQKAFGLTADRVDQILNALEVPNLRDEIIRKLQEAGDNQDGVMDRVRVTANLVGMNYPEALKANQNFVASMAKGKMKPLDAVLTDDVWDGKDNKERIFIAALIRQAVSGFELDQVDKLIQRLAKSNPRKKASIIEKAETSTPLELPPQWTFRVDERWTFTGDEDGANSGFTTAAGKVSN